jgi:precorrin-6Y C5,15-methyltransferase (decarboxylating)
MIPPTPIEPADLAPADIEAPEVEAAEAEPSEVEPPEVACDGPEGGRLDVVGLGPGDPDWLTPETARLLAAATDLVGYGPYLARLAAVPGQRRHVSDNREELARARHALALARAGGRVCVVSGGDPGVFAMAAAVIEAIDRDGEPGVPVEVHPGVSAVQAASARLGAVIGHDFAVLNLSDNLKPWELVERRLRLAAAADLVLALYNPASRARPHQIDRAVTALLSVKAPETVVILARAVGRADERVTVTTLGSVDTALIDMATLVLVGADATRVTAAGRVYTPRFVAAATPVVSAEAPSLPSVAPPAAPAAAPPATSAAVAPWLTIVGIGEDGRAGLSAAALAALDAAEIVVGGRRHLALVGPPDALGAAEGWPWPSPMTDLYPRIVAARGRRLVVLASGDPFHHGVGPSLAARVQPDEIRVLPAPSSFSLAAARLGWALQDVATVSLHGRAFARIVPHIRAGRRILALSWDGSTPARLAEHLVANGYEPSRLVVLEALGGPSERVTDTTAAGFGLDTVNPLNLVALEIRPGQDPRRQPLGFGLPDDLFAHDGQITKRDVRAVTLSSLAPEGGELLWDVGAGSGSIAVEWLLADPTNRAVAVEDRADRRANIAANAEAFGVPQLRVVAGRAPDVFADLDDPDAIFVGGGTSDDGLLDACCERLKPDGRLVANAVTVEGEAELLRRHAALGGALTRLHVERAAPLGGMTGFAPARAVTQWRWIKP